MSSRFEFLSKYAVPEKHYDVGNELHKVIDQKIKTMYPSQLISILHDNRQHVTKEHIDKIVHVRQWVPVALSRLVLNHPASTMEQHKAYMNEENPNLKSLPDHKRFPELLNQ